MSINSEYKVKETICKVQKAQIKKKKKKTLKSNTLYLLLHQLDSNKPKANTH